MVTDVASVSVNYITNKPLAKINSFTERLRSFKSHYLSYLYLSYKANLALLSIAAPFTTAVEWIAPAFAY